MERNYFQLRVFLESAQRLIESLNFAFAFNALALGFPCLAKASFSLCFLSPAESRFLL